MEQRDPDVKQSLNVFWTMARGGMLTCEAAELTLHACRLAGRGVSAYDAYKNGIVRHKVQLRERGYNELLLALAVSTRVTWLRWLVVTERSHASLAGVCSHCRLAHGITSRHRGCTRTCGQTRT